MEPIEVVRAPSQTQLDELSITAWPVWEHETATFPWTYDARERCYLLEGEVVVTPDGGLPVSFGAGDLVTFPAGMSCTWEIRRAVRKHYRFG